MLVSAYDMLQVARYRKSEEKTHVFSIKYIMYLLIKMDYVEENNMVPANNMTSLNISVIIINDEFYSLSFVFYDSVCVREQINIL